jgi:hypothetical protein
MPSDGKEAPMEGSILSFLKAEWKMSDIWAEPLVKIKYPVLLLVHWDEINNLYNGPSIDASYKVSIHLPKRF